MERQRSIDEARQSCRAVKGEGGGAANWRKLQKEGDDGEKAGQRGPDAEKPAEGATQRRGYGEVEQ